MESSSQVGVNHSFPAFGGNMFCWAAELTSTIIHQEVYPAILLQHWWHKFLHLTDTWGNQTTIELCLQLLTMNPLEEDCGKVHLVLISDVTLKRNNRCMAGRREFLSHLLSCCLQPSCIPTGDNHIATWWKNGGQRLWWPITSSKCICQLIKHMYFQMSSTNVSIIIIVTFKRSGISIQRWYRFKGDTEHFMQIMWHYRLQCLDPQGLVVC